MSFKKQSWTELDAIELNKINFFQSIENYKIYSSIDLSK